MKKLCVAATALLTAPMAYAGEIAYIAPDATTLEAPAAMGGGMGSWLIPLVILGVLVLSMSTPCDPKQTKNCDRDF